MKNIINYEILAAERLEDLEMEVRAGFHKGWQPLGGPFADRVRGDEDQPSLVMFYQATVQYQD